MTQNQIDMFFASHAGMFPTEVVPQIHEMLLRAPDNMSMMLQSINFKTPMTAFLLSLFLGEFGADRFYIGDTGMGIGKLLTAGGCGIWQIVDWFLIMEATRRKNFELLCQVLRF